jgi:cytochrome c oxidase subunit 7c
MYANVLARSAMRASSRKVIRSDLYHFENSNGQVNNSL